MRVEQLTSGGVDEPHKAQERSGVRKAGAVVEVAAPAWCGNLSLEGERRYLPLVVRIVMPMRTLNTRLAV